MASSLAEPLLSEPPSDTDENLNESTEDHAAQDPNQPFILPENNRSRKMSFFFVLTVSVVCIPMFLFGFNTGVLNAPESVIFPSHSVLEWSIAVSAFCVGGFVGAYGSGSASDRYGRRSCLIVIMTVNLVSGILHCIAPNMTLLIMARLGVGLAGGASTVLTPMMLSEISPTEIRGTIGTLTQLSCVLGILASILWALPFCTIDKWRTIFLPIPITALLGLLASPFWLPESPRWLLLNHYKSRGQEARNIMRMFRKISDPSAEEEVEMEVLLLLGEQAAPSTALVADHENEDGQEAASELPMFSRMATSSTADGATSEPQQQQHEDLNDRSFRSYATDPRNRIALASSILFPVAQQLSGINAVFYYSTSFFAGVIPNPQTGTIIAFSVNVLATLVALTLMDRLGRKALLSWSAGGMCGCCVLLTFSLLGTLPGYVTVVAVMLYISFFEIGLGCIPFFLASEMVAPEHLGTVQSISMSANWFSNFCVGILFPYMDRSLGAYSFVPFAIVLFGTVLYSLFVLPETRGKTLQEVRQELDGRHMAVATSEEAAEQAPVARSRQRPSMEAETALV
jgi:SP family facilitated glucose transporter-like MFS transporter 3